RPGTPPTSVRRRRYLQKSPASQRPALLLGIATARACRIRPALRIPAAWYFRVLRRPAARTPPTASPGFSSPKAVPETARRGRRPAIRAFRGTLPAPATPLAPLLRYAAARFSLVRFHGPHATRAL